MQNVTVQRILDNVAGYSAGGDVSNAPVLVEVGGKSYPVKGVTVQPDPTNTERPAKPQMVLVVDDSPTAQA
ncbi:MAG: hypothetical protein SFV32_12530 [Opitutaceae bacterium]|nr:hypothetical protein [Opitutaceae bacterium]